MNMTVLNFSHLVVGFHLTPKPSAIAFFTFLGIKEHFHICLVYSISRMKDFKFCGITMIFNSLITIIRQAVRCFFHTLTQPQMVAPVFNDSLLHFALPKNTNFQAKCVIFIRDKCHHLVVGFGMMNRHQVLIYTIVPWHSLKSETY